MKRFISVALSVVLACGMMPAAAWAEAAEEAAGLSVLAAPTADTSWYDATKSSFTLTNIRHLMGLSELVNAGNTFAGKTITLSGDIVGVNVTFTPIGTKSHPFNGTFDGASHSISNLKINTSSGQYAGLFGYTGSSSVIKNVKMANSVTLTCTAAEGSTTYFSDMGLLVGYSEGSISGCEVGGSVTMTSAVVQKSKDNPYVIERVGGIAGVVYGNVTNCSFTGSMSLTATSAPVSSYDNARLIRYVGGVVGYEGNFTQSGKTSNASSHGSITSCTNTGSITIETPSDAGKDRFGQTVQAQSTNVGGVAGYSRGSVTKCVNYGYLRITNAEIAGGIVGSLRSHEVDSANSSHGNTSGDGSDEGAENDAIVCSQNRNIGIVYARAAVGGIVGQAGTYTTIIGCMNGRTTTTRETLVVGTRWNKPFVGGIVGRTYGDVCYCGNLGIVSSGTWKNEAARSINKASGYYSSGIAGGILYYTKTNDAGVKERISPLPTAYNNYNAGNIETLQGYRVRAIVGNNEGYVYDNVALWGTTPDNQMTYGETSKDDDAVGTASNNVFALKDTGLKGTSSMTYCYRAVDSEDKEYFPEGTIDSVFQFINSRAASNNWEFYWQASNGSDNSGYPVLNWQASSYTPTDLSGATLSLVQNAKYTGSEAVPTVKATLGGKTLYQDVDFRVVPQKGAIKRSTGGAYKATIEGIGSYKGTSTATVAYDIGKGDLSETTVTADNKVFNYEVQRPSSISVKSASGAELAASEYTWKIKEDSPTNAGMYTIEVTATASSDYEGTGSGTFVISKAKFKNDIDIEKNGAKLLYQGQTYNWVTTNNDISEKGDKAPTFAYTGYPIQPQVTNVKYLNHTLVEGTDYVVKYGTLLGSDEDDDDGYKLNDNIGREGEKAYGAIVVRYAVGSNFSNYENMVFHIDGTNAKAKTTLTESNVVAPTDAVPYEGTPATPVKVVFGGTTLVEGTDYTITYKNNAAVGTASYTVTGMGRFTGTVSGTFKISDVSPVTYTYTIETASDGTKTATITGFKYTGLSETLDLTIPSEITEKGVKYPVTAIGEKAFGGSSASDWTGTNKSKIVSVTIPASVVSIGKYAFGAAQTNASSANLAQVTFEPGSKLKSIGEYAFAYTKLTEFRFPENVDVIGDGAFKNCTSIKRLVFETSSATLPSQVSAKGKTKGAFASVHGETNGKLEVVAQASATAVQKLVEENAGSNAGPTGGSWWVFKETSGNLSNATIAPIADVVVEKGSTQAQTPALTVTLNGQTLTQGIDYRAEYTNNVNPGTATVTLYAMGTYLGLTSTTFKIVVASPVDKSGLETAISAANTSLKDVKISTDGKDVEKTDKWVTQGAVDTLNQAIKDAKAVAADASATQAEVNAAIKALEEATKVFDAAKKPGEKGDQPTPPTPPTPPVQATIVRVSGNEAENTAVAISSAAFDKADTVIIANDRDFMDSMSATGLAGACDAPILLVNANGGLYEDTAAEISRLGATHAYIIGGVNAVTTNIEGQLEAIDVTSERIAGWEAWDTSVMCANKISEIAGGMSYAIVARSDNFQDALSMSSFAYKYKAAIILAPSWEGSPATSLPDGGLDVLNSAANTVFVAGGTGAIAESVTEGCNKTPERLWGNDGFDTSNQIATYMTNAGLLSAGTVCIASGASKPGGLDALAGAALAGKTGGVMLLANTRGDFDKDGTVSKVTITGADSQGNPAYFSANKSGVANAYVLGGAAVMPDDFYNEISAILTSE